VRRNVPSIFSVFVAAGESLWIDIMAVETRRSGEAGIGHQTSLWICHAELSLGALKEGQRM